MALSVASPEAVFAFLCVFIAAVIRGFSGLGFALLVIVSVSLVYPMTTIVPGMLLLEVVAGIRLLPSIWQDIHWRSICVMVASAVLCLPLGTCLLVLIPADPMKLLVAAIVFVSALVLLAGYQMKRMPGPVHTAMTGAAAGLLNGALGLGGPPIIIFFLGSPLALRAGRASIIAAFIVLDTASLPGMFLFGLFSRAALLFALLSLPALLAGLFLGSKLADRIHQYTARKVILLILLVMAIVNAASAIVAVAHTP